MNMQEKMMAHEDEKSLPERNAGHLTAQGVELADDALTASAGGAITDGYCSSGPACEVCRTDSRGNPTHWRYKGGSVFHYNCKRCGRLLHEGTNGVLYCDPCNTWFWDFTTDQVYD